jgi:hypothetical protein
MRRSPDRESKRARRDRHIPCTCVWGAGALHRESRWCTLPPELQLHFEWQLAKSVILARNTELCFDIRRHTALVYGNLYDGFPQYFSHTFMGRGWLIAGHPRLTAQREHSGYLAWRVWDLLEPIEPNGSFFAAMLPQAPYLARRVSNLNYGEALRLEGKQQ